MEKLLEINDLSVNYITDESVIHALNHFSLSVHKGETLGLVRNRAGKHHVPEHPRCCGS